jgi:hypothetical protein
MPEPDVTTTAIRRGVRDGIWHAAAANVIDTPTQDGDARHAGHAD